MTLSRIQTLGLLAFPILLLCLVQPLIHWRGPFFLARNQNFDPDYAYLMNSVSVLNGQTPGHRDHPGTLLQSFGAVTLKLAHPNADSNQITQSVLQDPEHHLNLLAVVLTTVCAGLLFLSGVWVTQASGSISSGILFQIIPFLSVNVWEYLGRFTPDLPTMIFGTIVCALAFARAETIAGAIGMGIACGWIVATKITGLPFLLFPVLRLIRHRKNFSALLLSFFAALSLGLIPFLWKPMNSWTYFTKVVADNSGLYAPSFSPSAGVLNFALAPLQWPLLALGLAAGIFLLKQRRHTPLVLISMTAIVAQMILVAGRPGVEHYVFPIYPAVALLAVLCLSSAPNILKPITQMVSISLILGLIFAIHNSSNFTHDSQINRQKIREVLEQTGCRETTMIPSNTMLYGLEFGMQWTNGAQGLDLIRAYKNACFFHPDTQRFSHFLDVPVSDSFITDGHPSICIVGMEGYPVPENARILLKTDLGDVVYLLTSKTR